ncbi:MAG TPA: hypothetical protein VN285_07340 [Candidatus Deferrimicrobium sp.]|nr:hypothetical protein [Candidatus Deferrimicrobium sp.]
MPAEPKSAQKKEPLWVVYGALLLAGLLMLIEAFHISRLNRWPAQLGIALVYSAVSLFVAEGRPAGWVAAVIVCLAAIVTIFV